MPSSSVRTATAITPGCTWSNWLNRVLQVSLNDAPRAISRPKKCFTWLVAMRIAAPAVKPVTTECEMKLTSEPMRASPITSWITPTRNVIVSARLTYCAVPGSACGESTENSTIEAAVVGPDTRCQEEPNSAAMIAGIIPAYSPYSGGMPAMVANATPCGSATSAPVSPAIRSSRRLFLLTRLRQRRNGSRRCQSRRRGGTPRREREVSIAGKIRSKGLIGS